MRVLGKVLRGAGIAIFFTLGIVGLLGDPRYEAWPFVGLGLLTLGVLEFPLSEWREKRCAS